LRYISQAAADHGIDFTLGVWQHNVQPNQMPTVEGLTRANIGPFSRAALTRVLEHCPAIRAVQLRTGGESGILRAHGQVEFFRDYIFPAIKSAGRILDLRGWIVAGGMIDAAKGVGVPIRLSTKYWAEYIGRPYQPAETFPNYSYLGFLEKPRPYQFYWEVWGLGSNRMLLWGSPDFVRRAVPTFRLSESIGFEIDAPPVQKGFGNRPGTWDVFTAAQSHRVFWRWDFERYWLFYRLWGRLSYDPKAPDAVWIDELRRRFGAGADAVLEAYRQSSRVLPELVAAHLADPNMYVWPEVNPGGLLEAYKGVPPSDWRYVASIPEAVHNLRSNIPSAKQTAANTADLLDSIAVATDQAVGRAAAMLPADHREWNGSRPDFEVLAHLARYHAHRQRGALNVEWFDSTGHPAALQTAKEHLTASVAQWEKLVEFTDGLYSTELAYGPQDIGHWKDKLPYVRHDLELIREREEVFARFGRFDFGFDFGAPFDPRIPTTNLNHPYVRMNHVAPRFQAVARDSLYNEPTGYGWGQAGPRALSPLPLTPFLEVQAQAKRPALLPRNTLFGDFFRGDGAHHFQVKAPPGKYQVSFLHPDRTVRTDSIATQDSLLRVVFPNGDWMVSGLVIHGPKSRLPPEPLVLPPALPRPRIQHQAPESAQAGKPLPLSITVDGAKAIRLHYRSLDQTTKFKVIEGGPQFTIPAEDISARWDLMYYFEVLNSAGSGWFYPDPATATPYFVVTTRP
jgi:hypothetical protein